ncbi:DNA/RNA polymerases superfamily protein [Gossypium australe]|uniref:DNA/RNA polymerases superfamily protein n=1 Tax=Gossypium australe TaxID=47621 RepID=A0A5B6WP60_9ROSI|nr:DNA/RNA polymerases superfamily protein [Gossypium australe]
MKSAHFIPSLDRLVELYISEIVRLHGVPLYIIFYIDLSFTSRFWKKIQAALGTKFNFSTAFHPQSDGSWEKYLPLIEFAYNNSFQTSIKMASYKALYGRKSRTPLNWTELSEKKIHGVELIREIEEKVRDRVFLKVSPWKKVLRFGCKGKLNPQFIGPYWIIERIGPVAYQLALSLKLERFRMFSISDPSHVISPVDVEIQANLTYSEEPIKILAREIKELRNKCIALMKVLWHKHGIEEATWEPEEALRKQYPNLFTSKIFTDENP